MSNFFLRRMLRTSFWRENPLHSLFISFFFPFSTMPKRIRDSDDYAQHTQDLVNYKPYKRRYQKYRKYNPAPPVIVLPSTRSGVFATVLQPNSSRYASVLRRWGSAPVAKRAPKPSPAAKKAKRASLNKLTKAQLVSKLC